MKYAEIRDLKGLNAARQRIAEELDLKSRELRGSLDDTRKACTTANILAAGIRRASSSIPLDRIVLMTIRAIKSRL